MRGTDAPLAAIDLLLSDVVMPQMSGPELYRRLTELRPGLRALFMSGYASSAVLHKGQLQEGVNLIAKPFTSEELLKKVERFLYQSTLPACPVPPALTKSLLGQREAAVGEVKKSA